MTYLLTYLLTHYLTVSSSRDCRRFISIRGSWVCREKIKTTSQKRQKTWT